jgi:regulator of ribosome biosynthesis
MTEVVSATDIVGDWEKNGSNGILDEVTVDDTVYDLRNLTACNYHAIQLDNDESLEEQLIESATIATQQLVKKIFECPIQPSDVGPVAVLPTEEVIRLPREKRVPDPKPETRWEKFAKEKNIKNKKRERMVFDEDTQEWKPRYGYKRANNGDLDIPIVEVSV